MAIEKAFKVKNGLIVGADGVFEGTVSVATPTSNTHAATKLYVDDLVSGIGGGAITVGDTPPTGASEGDLWYNSSDGSTFIFYDSFWVQSNASIAGPAGVVVATSPLSFDEQTSVLTIDLSAYATLVDLVTKIDESEKGAALGVATLDATGNVPASQLNNVDALPTQTGHAGEYLTTDGSLATWAPLTLDKTVNDLIDVTLTSPADGDALVYDSATSTWVNGVVDVAGAIATANAYTDSQIAAIPPTDLTGYATETYVNTAVSNLVDAAPGTLDTLNELAAALNDDANFAVTVTESIATKSDKLVSFTNKYASYTLVISDADKMVELNSASPITLTVPKDSNVDFPIGTTISILQTGAGQITVAAEDPLVVTINATPSLLLRTQWSSASLIKRAANTWYLAGDLE